MGNKKRGFHKRGKSFFRGNKLVLDSMKSKVAFFAIVFLFGVVKDV